MSLSRFSVGVNIFGGQYTTSPKFFKTKTALVGGMSSRYSGIISLGSYQFVAGKLGGFFLINLYVMVDCLVLIFDDSCRS